MSFELFADRFLSPRRLYEDPAFTLWVAEDAERRREVCVQALWSPGLREDVGLARQLHAVQAFEEARRLEPSEWIPFGDQALWVRKRVAGRRISEIAETQRDEVYLSWLRQALEILALHHDAGLWHLSQNAASWELLPDGEGGERLELVDLALFPDLPLGLRLQTETVAALPPEFFRDAPLDARADLYALACLILRQRSPKVFERVQGLGPWLDLHLGGRVAALVPKTISPLNELLRKMLQADPAARPADAHTALAEIPGASVPVPIKPPIADWIYERVLRRQASLSFRCIFDLQRAGDPRARELLETGPAQLREVYPACHALLRAELEWQGGNEAGAREIFQEVERLLELKPNPRLRAMAALSELRVRGRAGDREGHATALKRVETYLENDMDAESAAELHFERATAALARLDEAEALHATAEAWKYLREAVGSPLREVVGLRLADLLGSYGCAQEAWDVLQDLLVSKELKDPAGVEIAAALTAVQLERFESAKELFYRAKSRISAQKDLRRLLWAAAQEIRLFLAQGDFSQAGRELRVLKVRARSQENPPQLLLMVELAAALEQSPEVPPSSASEWEGSLVAWAGDQAPFRDLLWPPALSCEWLARAARLWGKEAEAEQLEKRAETLRPAREAFVLQASPPPPRTEERIEKQPEPVPLSTPETIPVSPVAAEPESTRVSSSEVERLRAENRSLKARIHRLEQELSQIRTARVAEPEVTETTSDAELTDLAAVRELMEKRSIAAMLRKHLGNRIEAARELKIHRRTLFEKIRRYGLTEADFMPGTEEVEAILAECRGNKSRAAERLGMSRSSFYRWLKDLQK